MGKEAKVMGYDEFGYEKRSMPPIIRPSGREVGVKCPWCEKWTGQVDLEEHYKTCPDFPWKKTLEKSERSSEEIEYLGWKISKQVTLAGEPFWVAERDGRRLEARTLEALKESILMKKIPPGPPPKPPEVVPERRPVEVYRGWSVSELVPPVAGIRYTAIKAEHEVGSDTIDNLKHAIDDLEEQEEEIKRIGYRPQEIPTTLRPFELEKWIKDVDKGEIRVQFPGGLLAAVRFRTPEGYVMRFREEPWRILLETPSYEIDELMREHDRLKWEHPDWEIVRKWDRRRAVNVFIGRPVPIRHVARADPSLMALEILGRKPERIEFHPVPAERLRVIYPYYPRTVPAI